MVIVELPEYSLRKICFGSWRKTFVDGSDFLHVYNLIYIGSTIIYHLSPVVFIERNQLASPTANMET